MPRKRNSRGQLRPLRQRRPRRAHVCSPGSLAQILTDVSASCDLYLKQLEGVMEGIPRVSQELAKAIRARQ